MSEQTIEKVYWEGPIGFEDQTTGDGRHIIEGALEWTATEEDPLPIRFVREDVGAHANAEVVGAITHIERREREENGIPIWGSGWLDVSDKNETGKYAAHLIQEKMQRGISMDLDDVSFEEVLQGDDPVTETHSARIRAATLVAIPAFAGALINLTTAVDVEELSDDETETQAAPSPENVEMHEEVLDAITDGLQTDEDDSGTLQTEPGDGAVIVLLPQEGEAVIQASSQPAHLTLAWLGPWAELEESPELYQGILSEIAELTGNLSPVTVRAMERGTLGDESADVVFIERSEELQNLRDAVVSQPLVAERMSQVEQFPDWTPHITLGYPDSPAPEDLPADWVPEDISMTKIAVWYGGSSTEFILGTSEVQITNEEETDMDEELSALIEKATELGVAPNVVESLKNVQKERQEEALVASSAPVKPSIEWFKNPELSAPTPITITEDGRIYGHLAAWDTCHTANPAGEGICVSPPSSNTGYARFHLGSLETAEGQTISVGKITMGTGHAGPNASAKATLAHYDNTGTAVADVRAGEDAWGIWIAGALRPGVSEERKRVLNASPLSGDWRRVDGNLELHAALAVNVPGFPIPNTRGLVASGELKALVASGIVVTEESTKNAEASLQAATSQLNGLESFSEEDVEFLKSMVASAKEVQKTKTRMRVKSFANRRKVESYMSKK